MRLAGTCSRYSNSAMPQLTTAAISHGRWLRFRRCAYQANVMKTLEQIRSATVLVMADMQTLENGLRCEQAGLDIQPRRRLHADGAAPGLGAREPAGFVLGTE